MNLMLRRTRRLFCCCALLLGAGPPAAPAQEGGGSADSSSLSDPSLLPPSRRLSLGLELGATITQPSGDFPSLLFIASADSTGHASSDRATGGIASRWVLSLYIPIVGRFGGVVEGGSRVWSIRYAEGEASRAVRMDLQTSAVALLGRIALVEPSSVEHDEGVFHAGIEGGIEFGFGPYRNRVETTIPADSGGTTLELVEGSFQGGDPFCGQTGLIGGAWGGFTVGESIDLRIHASYLRPFPPLFSDDAVVGNDARLSQFTINLGVHYLF